MNQKVLFSLARALKVYFNHAVVVGLLVLLAACSSAPASPSGDEVLPNAGAEPTEAAGQSAPASPSGDEVLPNAGAEPTEAAGQSAPASPSGDEVLPNAGAEPAEAAAQSPSGAPPSGDEVLPNVSISEPTPINTGTEPPSPDGAPASCDPDYVAAKVAAKFPDFFDADPHLVGDGQGNPILDVGVDSLVFVARYQPNGSGEISLRTGVIVDSGGHVTAVLGRVEQDRCTTVAIPRIGSFRGTIVRTDASTGAAIVAIEGTTALPSAEFGSGASLPTGQKVVSYQKRSVTQPWAAVPGTARSLSSFNPPQDLGGRYFGFVPHPDVGRPESVGDAVFDESGRLLGFIGFHPVSPIRMGKLWDPKNNPPTGGGYRSWTDVITAERLKLLLENRLRSP